MIEIAIDLFAEDHAHQALLEPLVGRVAAELDCDAIVSTRSARGGHPRVARELAVYQTIRAVGAQPRPDLVVIGVDANCRGYQEAKRLVDEQLDPALRQDCVIACPNPHVERWYMIDAVAFESVVGARPALPRGKCDREMYKDLLRAAVARAGHPSTLGGVEFARELAERMDLYRAGKADSAFRHFASDLRNAIAAVKVQRA